GEQARVILGIIERALAETGARLEHVTRTRIYVTDISQWEAIGRAHGERFASIRPATTMIEVSKLIDPGMVVEIEAGAWIEGGGRGRHCVRGWSRPVARARRRRGAPRRRKRHAWRPRCRRRRHPSPSRTIAP